MRCFGVRVALAALLVASLPARARPWRSLTPGESRRTDVVTELGLPSQTATVRDTEVLTWLGANAISGTTQVRVRVDAQSGVVQRIDVFPGPIITRAAIEESYGGRCAKGDKAMADCFLVRRTGGRQYLLYAGTGLAVFFDATGKVVTSLGFLPAGKKARAPASTGTDGRAGKPGEGSRGAADAGTPLPDTGLDVVETIVPSEETEAASPAPAANDRFQANSWVRSLDALGFGARGSHRDAPDPLVLPYDRLQSVNQLYVRLQYARGKSFEAVASGVLTFSLKEQEPDNPDTAFNGFNGPAHYALEPDLREAYVGFIGGPVTVRLGSQRVAWGKADLLTPNDVVNSRDLRDPLLTETELLHLPTVMARVDVDAPFGSFEVLAAPFFQPDRQDLYGSNWALVQPDAPWPVRAALALASSSPLGLSPINGLLLRTPRFKDAQVGARFTTSVGGVDLGLGYHYGFDPLPRLELPQELGALAQFDPATVPPQVLGMLADPSVMPALSVVYQRRHHAGLDVGTAFGSVALRLDASWDSAKVFFDEKLNGVTRPVAQAVLGVEYQTGELGKTLELELGYTRLLGAALPDPLYFFQKDTLSAGLLARWTFFEHLELEVRGLGGLLPRTYLVRPQLSLRFGGFGVSVGGVLAGGERLGLGHYTRRAVSGYVALKYLL